MNRAPLVALFGLLMLPWVSPAQAMPPGIDGLRTRKALDAIGRLDLERATAEITPVQKAYPNDIDVLSAQALLEFHRGDYAAATTHMNQALALGPDISADDDRRSYARIFAATAEATKDLRETRSEDGRFVVRFGGDDEILVPYALDALRKADTALTEALGYRHPGPIRLEIYPSTRTLAEVSSLTVEEIERTGTIALCKWDRLMVTSPRALLHGYPWVDTLDHEFVHLVLARSSSNRAPVWLQEGVAKFLERRWRGPEALKLDPSSEQLLAKAQEEGGLIPFDKLHPSIAMLPSQEDAALAFAQVATFIEHFVKRFGEGGLRNAIEKVAAGQDARDAMANAAGETWNDLEGSWKRAIASRKAATDGKAGPRHLDLQFQDEGLGDDASAIPRKDARRFVRLGDLLWTHGHPKGASREYERAHRLLPEEPIIASRLGRAALEGGDPALASRVLAPLRDLYPNYAPVRGLLGRALSELGKPAEARVELMESLWLNPFDPAPHCTLARLLKDPELHRRESIACQALGAYNAGR
ncbi:MAG: tetratricopeptide repeat protein [Myxococcales bacterium]|nr:tetratricopeptide repeat protein [Myxococcales bacterium]